MNCLPVTQLGVYVCVCQWHVQDTVTGCKGRRYGTARNFQLFLESDLSDLLGLKAG